jgi:hypothetical protein
MQITAVAANNDNDDVVSGAVTKQRINTALSSGVRYYDVIDGDASSLPVEEGRTVQFLWSLRRSNGYFVDASSNYGDEPFIYKVGNLKKAIKGIDEGIRGMRSGGIRRISVPPTMAFIEGVEDGTYLHVCYDDAYTYICYSIFYKYSLFKVNKHRHQPTFFRYCNIGKPGPLPAGFGPRRQILTRLDREVWNYEIKMLKVK